MPIDDFIQDADAADGQVGRDDARALQLACAPAAPRRRCSTASRSTTTGTPTPLKNLATINVPEPRMLTIQPFDPSSIKQIEKAIQESDLGLTPSNDGKLIRLPIPQLTEERRKELVKVVRQMAEEGRVAVRNVRRDVDEAPRRSSSKNGDVGDDEERAAEGRVQKLTDEHVAEDRRSAEAQRGRDHGGLGPP